MSAEKRKAVLNKAGHKRAEGIENRSNRDY
jgi:hypothetical protein